MLYLLPSFISPPSVPQLLPKMYYFQNTISFKQIQAQPWHTFKEFSLTIFHLLRDQTTSAFIDRVLQWGKVLVAGCLYCSSPQTGVWKIVNLTASKGEPKDEWWCSHISGFTLAEHTRLKKKAEYAYALAHLISFSCLCPHRHPVVRKWPRSYEWFFMKMNIEHIWLQSWYGEVSPIAVEEYLKAVPSKGWLNGLWDRNLLSFLSKHSKFHGRWFLYSDFFFSSPKRLQNSPVSHGVEWK